MGRIGAALCIVTLAWSVGASEIVSLVRNGPGDGSIERLGMIMSETDDPATLEVIVRIAVVWDAREVLPAIRDLGSKVTDAELAREIARALVILGGTEMRGEALALSDRFDGRLDPDVALAVARHGGVDAILLWSSELSQRSTGSILRDYLLLAMWERLNMLPVTSARILGSRDVRAWEAMISILEESELSLTRPILNVALTAEPPLSDPAFWYLARIYATKLIDDPAEARSFLDGLDRTQRSVEGSYAVELIERALGEPPRERKEWIAWLNSSDPKPSEFVRDFGRLLTLPERRALGEPDFVFERGMKRIPAPRAQFHFMHDLPYGWVEMVQAETRCESYWVGQPQLRVDELGRVVSLDTSGVAGGPGCVEAVELLGRLSLVANRVVTAPRSNVQPLIVKGPGSAPCVAEGPLPRHPDMPRLSVDSTRSAVDLPRVVRRVPAGVPADLRKKLTSPWEDAVSVRAEVASNGCVRVYGLDDQSSHSEINTAALMAVSMWEMAPGTLRGEPVPVDFNLTVTFSWRGSAVASSQ